MSKIVAKVAVKLDSRSGSFPEREDDEHGSEFQRREYCFLSGAGDVIPLST